MGLSSETMQQLIQEAINCIEKKTPKLSISGIDNIEKFEASVDIILNQHQYKNKSIKEYFNNLKCSEEFVKGNILNPALNSLKHENKVTIKGFNQKISEYVAKKVSIDNKWHFIFPVNFRVESKKGNQKEFEICENVVQLLNFHDFMKSEFWSDDVKQRLNEDFHDNRNLSKYSWGIISGEGKDSTFALNLSIKILNTFLGVVNLSYWLYTQRGFWFSRYPRTFGYTEIVTPSYVLQYDTNKEFEGLFHTEVGPMVDKYVVFSDDNTKKYHRLMALFEGLNRLDKESEIYQVIFEVLEIYNLALNKIGYDSGFLDLWTGVEKMTFKRREGRDKRDLLYNTVITRILGIMINPPEIIEIRLRDMLNKRHQIVHGGRYDIISQSDFNFLKRIYETVLTFLMNHNNTFKTIDEIELIYDKSGKTKEKLEDEVRVINYLVEEMEKSIKNREDKKS